MTSLAELYLKPGHLIRRAHQISWALFLEECADHNVTPVQYAALVAIGQHPGIDATRLSALIAFDRSTTGNVLERLEKRGLISRDRSAGDRRQKLLQLTADGAALLVVCRAGVERVQTRLLERLSPPDRTALTTMLATIVDAGGDDAPASGDTRRVAPSRE
ncbi:MarR family winged helix-turn-helix transcriptional regulator [Sphingomonas sp.]|uniref:MarR family winged helix-turn-helix transcriptional regulator n=1 Tax=Sphingomonas sp. TaxID=28214 RepID=UPI002DD62F6C|nr:MarR family transcriptional regulator [Sphingomonas sp.]